MTYAPQTIKDVMRVWTSNGGVNLGIVGDTGHVATGTSYHLGKDQLAAGAYSNNLARDRAGLTNAASAMDLGRLDGTLANLQKFSKWLVDRCKANASGTNDIREIIYSPDGTAVKRWDNHTNTLYAGGTGTGHGDNSHRTHTHISFYRDSEGRDKTGLFLPYFTVVAPPEDPMGFAQVEIPVNTWIYVNAVMDSDPLNVQVSPGRPMLLLKALAASGAHLIVHDSTFKHYYVRASEVKITPLYTTPPVVPPVVVPPTAAQCKVFSDASYSQGDAAGYARGKTEGIVIGSATGTMAGVEKEQARIKGVLGLK